MKIYQKTRTSSSKLSRTSYTALDNNHAAVLSVEHPKTYFYEGQQWEKLSGQGTLFGMVHEPAMITGLHSTPGASHLVSTLLAHAHRVHNGDITYGSGLSEYSLPLVHKAIKKGWVKENPDRPLESIEEANRYSAKYRAKTRGTTSSHHFSSDEVENYVKPDVGTEVPQSEVAAAQEHFKDLAGISRFKPKVSDSQLTLPGM